MLAVLSPLEIVIIASILIGLGLLLRRMGRWAFVFLAAMAVVCSVTNPNEDEHREAVSNRVQADLGPVERLAASALPVKNILPLKYENFLLGSIGTVNGRTVSFGLLRNVIVTTGQLGPDLRR